MDRIEQKQTHAMSGSENEQQYRQLFECNPHPMWIFDTESLSFLAVNDAAVYQYGFSREEFLGMTIKDIRPPEEVPRLLANVQAGHTGHDDAGVWKHRKKDGTVFDVEIVSHELKWAYRPAKLVLSLDVTARRRTERALRESQELLQDISDNSAAVIYVKDLEGRYLLVNRRFCEVFHLTPEAVVGKTDHDIFSKQTADAFRAMDQRVAVAGHALTEEETAPHEDGPHTYLSVKCPLKDDTGKPYNIFGISTDITDRKRGEKALRESAARLSGIIDSAMVGVVTTDEQQRITLFNTAAEHMFGYRAAEMLGQPLDLLLPEQFRAAHGEHIRSFGQSTVALRKRGDLGTVYGLRASGEQFPIEASISKVDIGGQPTFTAILSDITERKQAEEALREAEERFRTVADFTYDWEYWVGVDGKQIWASPSCEHLTGFRADEFMRDPGLRIEIVHPDDRATLEEHFRENFESNTAKPRTECLP